MMSPRLAILGTRGIPARHGGFETFAERLALHLVSRGWEVSVYCPDSGARAMFAEDWNGIRRIVVPVSQPNALGTIVFDWKSMLHAAREGETTLNLGYGTSLFLLVSLIRGARNLVNMDGLEWTRRKWSRAQRFWLYANERLACRLAHHLIADHPEIRSHLASRVSAEKITMIPYGADPVTLPPSPELVRRYGLQPDRYALVIARPDPDNSILEIVSAYCRKPRGFTLVILGEYDPAKEPYHRQVMKAMSWGDTRILGGIYERPVVEALRYYARLYIHGHMVGGTNPSLVEALAAGCAVLAHDNRFNRWVAGPGARYFRNEGECGDELDRLLEDPEELLRMGQASLLRHREEFTWEKVLTEYERVLTRWQGGS